MKEVLYLNDAELNAAIVDYLRKKGRIDDTVASVQLRYSVGVEVTTGQEAVIAVHLRRK